MPHELGQSGWTEDLRTLFLAFLKECYFSGAQRLVARAIGSPTKIVCPMGPVMIDAGSKLGGHR